MPAARSALPALTDPEVAALRDRLERGATPRVRLRAGGTGTVVRVGDPDQDGPEYIQVKVTLNGTRDTIPFAPEDLASTSHRAPAKGNAAAVDGGAVSRTPKGTTSQPTPPPPAAPPATAKSQRDPLLPAQGQVKRRRRQAQPRAAPNVVITLRTSEAGWLADATREGETITEAVAAAAEVVKSLADQIGNAPLSRAVADVTSAHRSAAADRVARLRAELNAAEGLLASFAPGRSTNSVGDRTAD